LGLRAAPLGVRLRLLLILFFALIYDGLGDRYNPADERIEASEFLGRSSLIHPPNNNALLATAGGKMLHEAPDMLQYFPCFTGPIILPHVRDVVPPSVLEVPELGCTLRKKGEHFISFVTLWHVAQRLDLALNSRDNTVPLL